MSSYTSETPDTSTVAAPSVTAQLGLADPDNSPQADVVIFDGNCKFCQKQVQRLNRFDGGGRLAFISLHDERVAQRYPELTHDQLMDQMYVVNGQGVTYGGAQAVRYLSRRLPRLWWAAPFLHIPFSMPVWQWLYRQVAERRYRLSQNDEADCDEGTCEVHLHK